MSVHIVSVITQIVVVYDNLRPTTTVIESLCKYVHFTKEWESNPQVSRKLKAQAEAVRLHVTHF